jgi:hypothetical protein
MTETPPLSALGIRKKFRSKLSCFNADVRSARKNICFWQKANITKNIYLFVDENEYVALPDDLKYFAISRPSSFSGTHANMQQWHLEFLRNRHPRTVVGLIDGDLPINSKGVSRSSKHFPVLGEVPPVRTENYVDPYIAGVHIRRAVMEWTNSGILLGGFPIDPATFKQDKGYCAYPPIFDWVVRDGYLRNFFIIFPTFQGCFGPSIGDGLGVLEDAHFSLSGGHENIGLYQGLCLRFSAAKGSSKRNTSVAHEAEKRKLAELLGRSFDEIRNYLSSRYIKKILNKTA